MPNKGRSRRTRWPSFTLEQLRTFSAVAAREHVTGAAAALGISQGTVSEQVRLLEDALGVTLVERAGRGIRVTEAGRAVQRLATAVLDAALAIDALGSDYRHGRRGAVRVGSGHVLGAHRLAAWLSRFVEDNPGIGVDIVLDGSSALVDRLLGGSIDIAIMSVGAVPTELEVVVLEETELVLVAAASHPLASEPEQDSSRLRSFRRLAHGGGSGTETLALQLLADLPEGTGPAVELEEGALLAALRAGLGWAAMPRSVVAADVASGVLVVLPHPGRSVVQRFSAVRRRGPSSAAGQAMWAHLSDIAGAAASLPRA